MRLILNPTLTIRPVLLVAALALATGCGSSGGAAGSGGAGGSQGDGGSAGEGGAGSGGDGGDAGGGGGPYELTVVDGNGSGSYIAGEQVHVFAQVNPFQAVVTGWQSSVATTAPSDEWHFVFTMPAEDVTLTPDIAQVSMDLSEIQVPGVANSKRVIYAVPPNAKGVLFTFHGTGGSADIVYNPAMQYVARLAYQRGYAIVSTDAEERTLNDGGSDGKIRWDALTDISTNIDLQNIQLLSDTLSTQTDVPASGPRFAVGMSNGGAFAVSVGATLPFGAVSSYCATGRTSAWSITQTPTQWLMCENDTNDTVSAKKDEWPDGFDDLTLRGIATDYGVHQPSPIYDVRFARIQGVNVAESKAAVAELLSKGAIDADGFMTMSATDLMADYDDNSASWPAMTALIQSSNYIDVKNEIKHAWADHTVHDDWAARTLDFMETQLP